MSQGQINKQRTAVLLPLALVALVSFAVYFNALSCGFVYDDKDQIVNNHWIRDVRYLNEIFSQSVWGFSTDVEEQGTANYYRPLMHLVYMANYYIFGMKAWGFHLVNVLFHMGNSVLVFLVVLRLLAEPTATGIKGVGIKPLQTSQDTGLVSFFSLFTVHYSLFSAFIAALLFATHPIHTEAVIWVASLPEVAFTFFCLLSFYFYMGYREGQDEESKGQTAKGKAQREESEGGGAAHAFYVLSLLSFSVSVLFKEPALTLPVLLMAYDLACRKEKISVSPFFLRQIPYFIIAGVYLLLRMNALKSMVPTVTFELSPWQSVINVFPLFTEYLKDLIFPFDLNFWHEFQILDSLFNATGLLTFSVAAAFAAALFFSFRKNRTIFLGLVLILVPLLPAFYIKGIGSKPYAERYLYLPSVGFVLILAVFMVWLLRKAPRYATAAAAAAFILAGAYSAQTIMRHAVWKDDFAFYEHTIKKTPDATHLRISYGVLLSDNRRTDEAIEQFLAAIRLKPNFWHAYGNLGIAYGKKGMYDKAIEQFEILKKYTPNSAINRSNLGNTYLLMGEIDKAIEELQTSVNLNPGFHAAHYNLGTAYENKGLTGKAVEEYQAALRLRPDYEEARYYLARLYTNSGKVDEAIEQFRYLISLRPDNATYHNTLGVLYVQKGSVGEAIRQFEEAVRLAPDKPSYRENLERALGQKK
jgi:tetratricopeptide (TPR) repeat protein